ncbi:hypothetical protein CY35_14G023000 [Sphagnum magellanicum]|nr:hypothetical protein CY35_14G023000 [Sphagnum magellanicum]
MGHYPTGPTACILDPTCHVMITSMWDGGPVCIFVFWVTVVLSCSTFFLWKQHYLKKHPVKPVVLQVGNLKGASHANQSSQSVPLQCNQSDPRGEHSGGTKNEEIRLSLEGESEIQFTGYTRSYFGEFCYLLCCLVSLHWIALYILILVDTYNNCEVGSIDNLCFFGNHFIFGTYELNGKVFFVVWWLSAFWFSAWVLNKGRVHNWFRMPCDLPHATFVYVWAPDQHRVLSVNVLFVVHILRKIRSATMTSKSRGHFETIEISITSSGRHYFLYQGQRYLLNSHSLQCVSLRDGYKFHEFYQGARGLSTKQADSNFDKIGPNEIPFKPETLMYTILDELFSLFHVYQLIMYMLQFWNSYLFVASLMTSIVLLSASITIYTRHHSQLAIAKITKYVTDATVLRDGVWVRLDSRNLVPGDIVKVQSDWLLPCDLLLIQGSCICNESALTGEAMPVQKYMAPDKPELYDPEGNGAQHTLFSGTTVLQAGTQSGCEVLAFVTATGMSTSKGKLLSSILYPEKMLFKYDEELPIVVMLLLAYAFVCFIISIVFQNHTGAQSYWVTKWIYCMAIVNQIMSPLLPVALEVGELHAVERLKAQRIFCLNPKRIAIAGKIRLFCFDKTGTLTKEGLDFIGIQSVLRTGPTFEPVKSPEKGDKIDFRTLNGLATCHAVTKFGDQFVGNQVEVKMFSSVGWELVEATSEPPRVRGPNGDELKIVKRNEFNHARTTMSVVVEDCHGELHVYCKGSFEKIQELSLEGTLPTDYVQTAHSHALDGCYVLGLGYRNELKHDSRAAIQALKEGEVRPVMVTGDNAQCGHYIAKECAMVEPHVQVLLGDVDKQGSVSWVPMSMKDESQIHAMSTDELLRYHRKDLEDGVQELAVTGKAFAILRRSEVMDKLLYFTRIYARFTPADKVLVANLHRDHGLVVGMCGDGGNDCGALRAAHVGIALSDAEASVVSPFTSQDKSVTSVMDLLREGRAALHTSFACYKFLIMYGLMFSILKLCCYWYGIILSQMDYIFIDGVAVLILGYAMTLCYPEDKLGKVRPTSSLLGPLNVASVVGVWGINIVFLVGALRFMHTQTGYVKWPASYSHGASWWTLADNWESTVIFFVMYFQFITSAFVYTFGSVFRKSVFLNWVLMVSYGGLLMFMSVILLLPANAFTSLWHVASEQFNRPNPSSPVWIEYQEHGGKPSPAMSLSFRLSMWWLILGNLAVIIFWQKAIVLHNLWRASNQTYAFVVAEGPVAKAFALRFPSSRPKFRL